MNKVIAIAGYVVQQTIIQFMMFCLIVGAGAQSLIVISTLSGPASQPTVMSPSKDPVPVVITAGEDTRGDSQHSDVRVSTSYEEPWVESDRNPPLLD